MSVKGSQAKEKSITQNIIPKYIAGFLVVIFYCFTELLKFLGITLGWENQTFKKKKKIKCVSDLGFSSGTIGN